MASDLPSFDFGGDASPVEPTPPSPTKERTFDLPDSVYDGNTLSPLSARFPLIGSLSGSLASPARSSHLSPSFDSASDSDSSRQPFNFAPQQYVVSRPPGALASQQKQTELGRRRGHKYARSSVSHQIILSPTPRLPLQLPTSLPIPTFKEFRASMTSQQRTKWLTCLAQLAVAGYVQWQAHESMAMTALSHLLFFDALSSMLCTTVLVGRNFEVWTRSSLRHPFGLERTELVAGLAMSIVLLFMGIDLISHGLTHSLENVGGHEAHHAHSHHEHDHEGGGNLACLAAIATAFVSSASTGSGSRIGRSVRSSETLPGWVPQVLRNPPHLLILVGATLLLALPVLGIERTTFLDNGLTFTIAAAMMFHGGRSCYTIGRVLLMSFPAAASEDSDEIRDLVAELWDDDAIAEVQETKIWQVHYGLCIANFKLKVRSKDAVERTRAKINDLVRSRLADEPGKSNVQWEVSSEISVVDKEY